MQLRNKQDKTSTSTTSNQSKSSTSDASTTKPSTRNNNNNNTTSLVQINIKDRSSVRRVGNVGSVIDCNTSFHHNLRTRGRSKGLARLRILNNNITDNTTNIIEAVDNESFICDKLNANNQNASDTNTLLKSSPSSGSSGIASLSKDSSDEDNDVTVRSTSSNIKRTKRSLSSSRVEKDRVDEKCIKVLRKNCAQQQQPPTLHSARQVSKMRTTVSATATATSSACKTAADSRIGSSNSSNTNSCNNSNIKKSTNDASNTSSIKSDTIATIKIRKR